MRAMSLITRNQTEIIKIHAKTKKQKYFIAYKMSVPQGKKILLAKITAHHFLHYNLLRGIKQVLFKIFLQLMTYAHTNLLLLVFFLLISNDIRGLQKFLSQNFPHVKIVDIYFASLVARRRGAPKNYR